MGSPTEGQAGRVAAPAGVVDSATGLGYFSHMTEPTHPQQIDGPSFWAGSITRLIRDLGISTVLLCAVGYGIWKGTQWFGGEVAMPVVQRHLRYLDRHEEQMDKQIEILDYISHGQEKVLDVLQTNQGHIKKNGEAIETILDEIHSKKLETNP